MKRKPYFPGMISLKRSWASNYQTKIAANGAALGMSPADITAEENACQKIMDKIDEADAKQAEAMALNAERDLLIKNQMDTLRPNIRTHKAHTGYSENIGQDLGIIGEEVVIDLENVKTAVKLTNAPQGVVIKFGLENCERANIYCKRGTETAFSFLQTVTHPHTVDTRPNLGGIATELRQYYVILMVNDVEVGKASAIETTHN